MIYKVTHWLCKDELAYVIEFDNDLCKVHYLLTGKEEWIHMDWLQEYIVNKGR